LWNWCRNTTNGQSDRRKVTITLMNEARQPIKHWHCNNSWVTKIEGPTFKASGNEVTVESVEITHEGLTIESAAK
jgi:phage tail-like protein